MTTSLEGPICVAVSDLDVHDPSLAMFTVWHYRPPNGVNWLGQLAVVT